MNATFARNDAPATRLTGRVVLVTGGARGQGASHAHRLAAEGATVWACDVLDSEGAALAARLEGEGLDVRYRHLDVTSPEAWASVVGEIEAAHRQLDGLVNNAGIIHVTPIAEETLDAWNRLLAVNVTGALLGMQACLPLLRRSGAAAVVNVASIFGVIGAPGYVAYCASKGALVAMTKVAALELAPDQIRVNTLVPGGVSTPMNEHEKEGGVIPDTPLKRRAHVSELSSAVAFLLSSDASFVTGTELVVDGGFLSR
ncbi:SDR family NAD(P)-dependent oxidoreductase [Microlunatus antarcticus]|uniref:NAD(P)-dependent dehydrogenase (Short-subunit alcohol dehydrogenase family) n=1 Tax=Microlunatus antarcticus TaxID=53388 RepID=A0A7W5K0E2_9ACTN|nr:NAD(P)-dependent dehydrogenase (short-subunit alcohol dehydrogenase family) [Microlunatus antarcticus]MBB3329135.1 NAD(P)-dependent dehydrogenase (short-subunit alcohol dehydrogenase family) [Microlunatus antarcticus]